MIQLTEDQIGIEGCVYKLYCGEKYVIVKAQTLFGSISTIKIDYDRFERLEYKDFEGHNWYYFKFFSYVHKNFNLPKKIEILLESNNAYELLKREETELGKNFCDVRCLNNNAHAYVPKKRKDGSYGWIKPTWVLNYLRFLKHM